MFSAGDCTQSKPYICSVTPLPTTPSYSHTPPCGQFWYDKDINSCFYGKLVGLGPPATALGLNFNPIAVELNKRCLLPPLAALALNFFNAYLVSVSSAALSFYDAERACQQNGYHLASILSNEDRMFFPSTQENSNKQGDYCRACQEGGIRLVRSVS